MASYLNYNYDKLLKRQLWQAIKTITKISF